MSHIKLSDLPASFQNQALSQLAKQVEPEPVQPDTSIKTAFSIAPSTDEDKLNKTESAYLDELRSNDQYIAVHIQAITLKLGDDCRYTPDFLTIDRNGKCKCHETKGFWRDDARVKIKCAARMYRWIEFVAVTKQKSDWIYEQIKP